jgi:hypothetical protein
MIAVCFPAVEGRRAVTATKILSVGYGLQMVRINAAPNTAKMVKLKPLGDRPAQSLVEHPVN